MVFIISLLFILFPIPSVVALIFGIIVDKRHSKLYLLFLCLAIASVGLYYEPSMTADGSKVLSRLNVYSTWNFSQFIKYHGFKKEPISQLLFFLSSKSVTPKVLFAISGFLTYFLTLYPVVDYCNEVKAKISTRSLAVILIIAYNTIVSNYGAVRYPLGLSVLIFAWYIGFIKNKKLLGIFLSIVTILIHNSYISFVGVLILSLITYNETKTRSRFSTYVLWMGLLAWSIFSTSLTEILINLTSNDILNTVGKKLDIYIDRGYTNSWYIMLAISGGVVSIISLYTILKKRNYGGIIFNLFNENKLYFYIVSNYMIFVLGSVIFANIFVRLLIASVMFSVIPIVIQNKERNYHTLVFNTIMIAASITGIVYQINMGLNVENGWFSIIFKNIFSLWLNKLF